MKTTIYSKLILPLIFVCSFFFLSSFSNLCFSETLKFIPAGELVGVNNAEDITDITIPELEEGCVNDAAESCWEWGADSPLDDEVRGEIVSALENFFNTNGSTGAVVTDNTDISKWSVDAPLNKEGVRSLVYSFIGYEEETRQPLSNNKRTQRIKDDDVRELHLYSEIVGGGVIPFDSGASGDSAVGEQIRKIVRHLFSIIFTVSATLMVVLLAIHGTKMIWSQAHGSVSGYIDAMKKLRDVVIGALLLLLSWVFLNFIGGGLLQPEFFRTITNLRNLGVGDDVVTRDVVVPDNAVNFKEDSDTGNVMLAISKCPIMEDKFEKQVEEIQKSLGGEKDFVFIKRYYLILYSTYTGDVKSRLLDGTTGGGEGLSAGTSHLHPCVEKGDKKNTVFNVSIEEEDVVKTVAVFPIVRIVEELRGEDPENPGVKVDGKERVRRSWRGIPERHSTDLKLDDLTSLTVSIGNIVVQPGRYENMPDVVSIMIPEPELSALSDNLTEDQRERIQGTEYEVDSSDNRFCSFLNGTINPPCRDSEVSRGSSSHDPSQEGRFALLVGADIGDEFRIFPVVRYQSGGGPGANRDDERGKPACFEVVGSGGVKSIKRIVCD